MQLLQYDLRCPAAKDNSITHADAAPSNLDAATTLRSAETKLQKTIELRAAAFEILSTKTGSRRQSKKKTEILKHFLKGILKGKSPASKLRKSRDKSLAPPWCSHSNTIYHVQLQKTIVLRTQPRRQATLTQPLQCDPQKKIPCARRPSNSYGPTVEDVKTRLLCEMPFQFQQLKMWKLSFCARHPSNSNSRRCENEAFVRDILQIPTVEDVKTKLLCETFFKFQPLKKDWQ